MTQQDKFDDNDDRQQRFQRRRSQARTSTPDDAPRTRRTNPYKREHINYDDYLDEDDWSDDND